METTDHTCWTWHSKSLHAPSTASYFDNFHFFLSGKPQSVQEVSVLTLYSYLAYHLCFLKTSAIKITSEHGFSFWCQAVTGQAVITVSQPRASANLPLGAATELTLPARRQQAPTAGSTTQASCCNAQPGGKDSSWKSKIICESILGDKGCCHYLAPLPARLWCEGPEASGSPFQTDSIC